MLEEELNLIERPMSFIIVDDDKISNMVCRLTILKRNKNANIQLFQDPEAALESIGQSISQTGIPSETILLLDINMPVMNGWEFLDELWKFGETICSQFTIYMFSSSIDPSDIARSKNHSLVSEMFSKPLAPLHLQTIWENHD